MKSDVNEKAQLIKNLLLAALMDGLCIGSVDGLKKKIETWAATIQIAPGEVQKAVEEVLHETKTPEAEYLLKLLKKLNFTALSPNQ
jgi:hypothetical protein